jgi:hypothetical protein
MLRLNTAIREKKKLAIQRIRKKLYEKYGCSKIVVTD